MDTAKISNEKQFQKAVDEYVANGITNPSEISKLLQERGCYAAAAAIQLYLAKK